MTTTPPEATTPDPRAAAAPDPAEQPVLAAVIDFIGGFGGRDLSADVVHQARRMVLDTVGCAIGGSRATPALPIIAAAQDWSAGGPSDILGTGVRTSPVDAAFVNSYLGDVLDYEETLVSHPGAVIVATALAVGQHVGATGDAVLRATVAGYEIGSRVGRALIPSPELGREAASEFWWKPVSAVVTAGLLLGLDREQWTHAIGYATAAAPAARRGGFEARPLSWHKANYQGQAQVGVTAAYLAARGFRTYRGMFDGTRTFGQLLGSDRWDPTAALDGLGERWEITRAGFKAYPCCLYLHPLLDALARARRLRPFTLDDLRQVELVVPALIANEMDDRRPAGLIDAEFSAPVAAAALLVDPDPGADWLADDRLRSPAFQRVVDQISLTESADYTARYRQDRRIRSLARLHLADGTTAEAEVVTVHGSAADPLSDGELREKFLRTVTGVLTPHAAETAIAVIDRLDAVDDLDELMTPLRP